MAIGEPYIHVECDKCNYVTDPMEMTSLAGGAWDARNIKPRLLREGWALAGKQTICPDCVESLGE